MAPLRILLVDDDKAFNFLNRIMLREHLPGCEIAEATDGKQALDYIDSSDQCPDLIFLDINMPGLDGFDFLREFETRVKCHERANIFMLTSSIREEDLLAAKEYSQVKGYFCKPLSAENIKELKALWVK